MKRVYVAAPYTQGDVAANVRRAIDAAEELIQAGHFPYTPHLSHFHHLIYPHDWQEWLAQDIEWLAQCDAMVVLDGPSRGTEIEIGISKQWDIPVYRGVKEFLKEIL